MAAAIFVTDEAEGERGDEGNEVDVGEGEVEVPEPSRSKALEGNQTQDQLEAQKDHCEKDKGHRC